MYLSFVSGLALLLASPTVQHDARDEAREILSETGVLPQAVGVWQSRESGWILEVGHAGIQRWQDTSAGCYATQSDGPTFMGSVEYRYFTALGDNAARFAYLPGDGHARFQRLDALPPHCTDTPGTDPEAVFEVFVGIFEQHYAHFARRDADWTSLVESARTHLHTDMDDAALFDLLAGLLEPLGDSHTKLIAEINGERRRAQFGLGETLPRIESTLGETPWLIGLIQQLFANVLDPGARHIANDRVIIGTIDERVGYMQFLTMGGFTSGQPAGTPEWARAELDALDTILDDALVQFEGMDAVILDLTNNRGGYDAICRSIASRFTDHAFTGYQVRSEDSEPPRAIYTISPHDGPRFTGPVYVLTSDVTVSCGEITTMMLRQLGNVRQAGGTTRGAFSTPLAKPLPNGWYLELSNEIFADADNEVYEGRGLSPDIAVEPFPAEAPVVGHAALIDRVVNMIYADGE